MTIKLLSLSTGLLILLINAGCSQGDMPVTTAGQHVPDTINADSLSVDACAIVATPAEITADNAIDRSITRYKKQITAAINPLPRLERLGWAYIEKARGSRDSGYYTLAEQAALCIEHRAPGSAEALLLRGHVLHNLHRFIEAEELARRLVKQRGAWFDYALLGDVLLERGAVDEAVTAYQQVVDIRPGPQAYTRVSKIRWLKGDLDGALDSMMLAVRSTSPRTPEAAAWAHVQLAQLLMQTEEMQAAAAVISRALDLMPDYAPALHARGRQLLSQDQWHEAILYLRRAILADPLPEYRWTLYEALRASGQQANADKQQAALHKSGAIEDRRTYALFLATAGIEPQTALKLAQQELTQREDVFTLDAVAWALSAAGNYAEAFDYSRRALAVGTHDARLQLHGGVIAARAGKYERALELLNLAKTRQHMLLPSERQQLVNEFAALRPQIQIRNPTKPVPRENYYF